MYARQTFAPSTSNLANLVHLRLESVRRTDMRLRQRHLDNSVIEITRQQNSWQVQLVIPRDDGTQLNLVGIQTSTLDEAKQLSARAMKKENPKHACSSACEVWRVLGRSAYATKAHAR